MEGEKEAAPQQVESEGEDEVQEQGTVPWQKMPKNGGPKCEYEVSRSKNAGKRCGRGGLYPLDGHKYCLIHFRVMKSRQERANKPAPQRKRKREESESKPAPSQTSTTARNQGGSPYPEADQQGAAKRIKGQTQPPSGPEDPDSDSGGGQGEPEEDADQYSRGGRQKVTSLPLPPADPPSPARAGNGSVRGGHSGRGRGGGGRGKAVSYEQESSGSEDDSSSEDSEESTDEEGYAEAYEQYRKGRARKENKPINERYAYKGSRTSLWKSMKRATELATLGGARRPGSGLFNILNAHE